MMQFNNIDRLRRAIEIRREGKIPIQLPIIALRFEEDRVLVDNVMLSDSDAESYLAQRVPVDGGQNLILDFSCCG